MKIIEMVYLRLSFHGQSIAERYNDVYVLFSGAYMEIMRDTMMFTFQIILDIIFPAMVHLKS